MKFNEQAFPMSRRAHRDRRCEMYRLRGQAALASNLDLALKAAETFRAGAWRAQARQAQSAKSPGGLSLPLDELANGQVRGGGATIDADPCVFPNAACPCVLHANDLMRRLHRRGLRDSIAVTCACESQRRWGPVTTIFYGCRNHRLDLNTGAKRS